MILRRAVVVIGLAMGLCITQAEEPSPRIVTLSPALARIVCDLGLTDQIVGVSRWTTLPELAQVTVVGDAAAIDTERLLTVRPSLVLTQQSALDNLEAAQRLAPSLRIELFSIETLDDILSAIRRIGALTGRTNEAEQCIRSWEPPREALPAHGTRVVFVMGTDRPYAAGGDSFLDDLMHACGAVNAGMDLPGEFRWTATDAESLLAIHPDIFVCQIRDPRQTTEAKAYWRRWFDRAGQTQTIIRVTANPEWTIPSTRLLNMADEAATLFSAP